jgi:hypothetical protein
LAEDSTVILVFLGFIGGLSLGLVGGYLLAQIVLAKNSVVRVERDEKGYTIIEH